MNKNAKKWIFNALFLALVFGATIYGLFNGQDFSELSKNLERADFRWMIPAIFCVVMFICLESLIIYYLVHSLRCRARLPHCFLYSFAGFFFSCITPMVGGGQPAQIYLMNRDDIPVSVATPVLMVVTITYKLVLILVGAVVLLFRPGAVGEYIEPVLPWCWLGFALAFSFTALLLALVYCPTLVERPLLWCMRRFARRFCPEKEKQWEERLGGFVMQYRDVSDYFKTHTQVILIVLLVTFVQRFALFGVTYFSCRALGAPAAGFIKLAVLQAMISVAADMLPLPGGMGITESLFLKMFSPIWGDAALPVLIVSRGTSYYIQLIICAVFTALAYFTIAKKRKE